ncbi:hypothetical protein Tco_0835404 [Tanacetum coccineum]
MAASVKARISLIKFESVEGHFYQSSLNRLPGLDRGFHRDLAEKVLISSIFLCSGAVVGQYLLRNFVFRSSQVVIDTRRLNKRYNQLRKQANGFKRTQANECTSNNNLTSLKLPTINVLRVRDSFTTFEAEKELLRMCYLEHAEFKKGNTTNERNTSEKDIHLLVYGWIKTSDASAGDKDSSGIVSDLMNDQSLKNQSNTSRDESSRSRNECNDKSTFGDDTNIRPSYDTEPMVEVPYTAEYNVFDVESQHSKQPKNMNDTSLMKKVDSNTTPDSSDMCNNEFKDDQNVDDHEDEHVVLADLIANLKCDIDENKKDSKAIKKCKYIICS